MDDENEPEAMEDDDVDGLFDWAVDTFNSGGTDLNEYTTTLTKGKLTSLSDGNTTVNF
jgi:hypothetical protein